MQNITNLEIGVRAEVAAAELNLSLSTVRAMVRDGRIRSTRVGRSVRIPVDELRRVAAGVAA